MIFHFTIAMILIPLAVSAASRDLCEVQQRAKVVKNIPVPDGVNYFIRGAPSTEEVGFATTKGNFLLDTKNRNMMAVPGSIDPVLTPDGKVVSIPQFLYFDPQTKSYSTDSPGSFDGYVVEGDTVNQCKNGGCDIEPVKMTIEEVKKSGKPYRAQFMTFYARDNISAGPLFYDQSVNNNYQSFGALKNQESSAVYRMLYESSNGLAIRDYQLDSNGKSFSPMGPVKTVCGGKKGFIPAINKTGDEYAAYDPENGVTQIFYIGKSGHECQLKDTIPGLVGKIDFSPNGKYLAYHVDHKQDRNDTKNVVRYADERNNIEAAIFDREAKLPMTIALSEKTNSYYPVFLNDNTVAYINSVISEYWQTKPSFAIQLVRLESVTTPNCSDCYSPYTNNGQLAATIGALRLKQCQKKPNYYYKNAISSFSHLKPSQCKELVNSCDSACLSEIRSSVNDVSSQGGLIVRGVPLSSRQPWNLESVSKVNTKELLSFCDAFSRANTESSKKSRTINRTKQ